MIAMPCFFDTERNTEFAQQVAEAVPTKSKLLVMCNRGLPLPSSPVIDRRHMCESQEERWRQLLSDLARIQRPAKIQIVRLDERRVL